MTECFYSFYYTQFDQYKCTNNSNCPQEAHLYIKNLKKCTNDCKKEDKYQYQYGGQCLENCPNYTSPNEDNKCIDDNIDFCSKSENKIELQEFLSSGGVDFNAKNYAKEFGYTLKHVSHFYNNIYSILIYKDVNCIDELSINIPKVDFGDCYIKVQENLDPPTNDKLIVALVERENEQKKSSISYFFYHPETGEKLDSENLCKNEKIVVKENVLNLLNKSEVDLNSILHLTQQSINVFNLTDEFYTDICYHFDSINGKDVPLKDRVKAYYPNISLCEAGCFSKGVNLTTMESICQCKFNDFMSNELIEGNVFIKNTLGEITEILSSSNIFVLKCYKNVFTKENILDNYGGFIIILITLCQITLSLLFIFYDLIVIRRYLYNLAEYFLLYIKKENQEIKNDSNIEANSKINYPPKKGQNVSNKRKIFIYRKRRIKKRKLRIKINNEENSSKDSNLTKTEEKKLIKRKKTFHKSLSRYLKKENPLTLYIQEEKINLEILDKAKDSCGIDMEEYLKPELDDMEYDDAIKFDKRDFCEFFIDILKQRQILIDTLFNKEKLRPMSIKIILFLLNVDLYFVINGLFFDEEYLSRLFNSNEKESFFSFIPRSISRFFYAVIVGFIVKIIIDCIFIEEKKVKRTLLREKGEAIQLRYEILMIGESIKIRYTVFIFLCIFISIISWYYISCFNNTYPGVKNEWIKSSIAIIIIIQILTILIVFLQSILRSLSFHCKSEKIYKAKQLIS